MKEDRIDLGAGDILRFVGSQLDGLEEDLRLIEDAVLATAGANSSNRRVVQNFDRSLQVLQDLSRLCAGVSGDVQSERIEVHHVSAHLRLGHLKAELTNADMHKSDQPSEPDFFD